MKKKREKEKRYIMFFQGKNLSTNLNLYQFSEVDEFKWEERENENEILGTTIIVEPRKLERLHIIIKNLIDKFSVEKNNIAFSQTKKKKDWIHVFSVEKEIKNITLSN